MKIRLAAMAAIAAAVSSLSFAQPASPGTGVDGARIVESRSGRMALQRPHLFSEQRFSPLKQIDASNVGKLGVAWEYRTYSVRGLEATPIVADGVMYITESLEQGRRARCEDRQGTLDLRSESAGRHGPLCLLRCRQSRRGAMEGRACSSARSTDV